MPRYNHSAVTKCDGDVDGDGDYLDAVVVQKKHNSEGPIKTAVVTAGVVVPGIASYRERHPDELECQIGVEQSKMMRFEDSNKHATAGDEREGDPVRKIITLDWFVYTVAAMAVVFLALVGYGFGSGLYLPKRASESDPNAAGNDDAAPGMNDGSFPEAEFSDSEILVDRQDYKYNILTMLGLPAVMERASPQARAIEWLAFDDDPLFDPTTIVVSEDQDHLEQRYALVVWYFDQGGPTMWTTINREASSGWIEYGAGIHECDWRGVDCDYDEGNQDIGKIIGLRLSPIMGLLMTGSSLSTELGMLTGLRRIDFSDQRLQGKIPDEWSVLSNLELLVLSKNQLQSTIPEWIGGLTNLQHLALDANLLYGTIPSSVATLQNLERLDLHENPQLRGRFDDVLFSSISSTSNESGPRYSLEYLDLSNTDLEGELPKISLPSLRFLRLWNTNGFGGTIPPEIGSWSNLEYLSIKENPKLVGSIPTELGLLQNLETLELLESNFMSGTLPAELGNLSSDNLKVINFRYNNQTGTLPPEWSSLGGLQQIDISTNPLEGTVPPEYSKMTSLQFLDLRGTKLTGEIPDGVCSLESREEFLADCSSNKENTIGKIICLCCVWCNSGNGGAN